VVNLKYKEKEMLEFLKGHLWWILQLTGSIGVFIALAYGRVKGLNWNSYLVYILISILICSWMFLKSYEIAPSFFQAWFVGAAALFLCGFGGSILYFKEVLDLVNFIGAAVVLVGSFLLII